MFSTSKNIHNSVAVLLLLIFASCSEEEVSPRQPIFEVSIENQSYKFFDTYWESEGEDENGHYLWSLIFTSENLNYSPENSFSGSGDMLRIWLRSTKQDSLATGIYSYDSEAALEAFTFRGGGFMLGVDEKDPMKVEKGYIFTGGNFELSVEDGSYVFDVKMEVTPSKADDPGNIDTEADPITISGNWKINPKVKITDSQID